MILVKVLERKIVIQLFGLGFLLAPAINTLLSMSLQLVENRWTYAQMTKVLGAQTTTNHVLTLCSLILGVSMLSGSKKSWRFALALIGIHIMVQLPKLGQDVRNSWIYGLGFLVNVATFLFIGDQLVFKQAKPAKAVEPKPVADKVEVAQAFVKPAEPIAVAPQTAPIVEEIKPIPEPILPAYVPTPKHVVSKQRILVSFAGEEPWAQISKIDNEGIELKQFGSRPQNVESKQIEMALGPHLVLKMKFSGELGNRLYFKYSKTTAFELKQLNNWLLQQSQSA